MRRPRGAARVAFRLPILLFRLGLGWLFGGRLLLLEHTGRTSGSTRRTVLEVVEHDRSDGSYVVASGFGPGSDWYRNLQAHPRAAIRLGPRRPVSATFLPPEAGAEVMVGYARRHPALAPRLCRVLGHSVDGTPDGYRRVGRALSFVRLRPCPDDGIAGT